MKNKNREEQDFQEDQNEQEKQEILKKKRKRAFMVWGVALVFLIFGFFEPTSLFIGMLLSYVAWRMFTADKRAHIQKEMEEAEQQERMTRRARREMDDYDDLVDSLKRVKAKATDAPLEKLDPATMPELITSKSEEDLDEDECADYVVINVKTTDSDDGQDEVTRIAAVKFKGNEPVSYLMSKEKALPSLAGFVGDADVIVGHDLISDVKFMYANGFNIFEKDRKYFDTREIAEHYFEVSNYDLGSLCRFYNIYYNDELDALHNCIATGQLFGELVSEIYDE